jgi:hypothetical protein
MVHPQRTGNFSSMQVCGSVLASTIALFENVFLQQKPGNLKNGANTQLQLKTTLTFRLLGSQVRDDFFRELHSFLSVEAEILFHDKHRRPWASVCKRAPSCLPPVS